MNNKKLRVGLIGSFCAIELGLFIAVLTCSGGMKRPYSIVHDFFYIPSQTLLSISCSLENKKN